MKTIILFAILLMVVIPLNACDSFSPTQVTDIRDQTEEAEIRSVVEGFGQRLQFVSLQSPEAPQEINAQYGGFVASTLLEDWMGDISQAPGRMVSSPWPDRIEVSAMDKVTDGVYQVSGFVVQFTSVEAVEDRAAAQLPVKIVLQRIQDRWLITDYTEGSGLCVTHTVLSNMPEPTPNPLSTTPASSPTDTLESPLIIKSPSLPGYEVPTQTAQRLKNEIHFRKGGSSACIQKPIVVGKPQVYAFRALAGQTLILTTTSPNTDVYMDLVGLEDGLRLVSAKENISDWSGTLHKSQPYQVTLTTDNTDTYFFLSIEIPVTIQFEPGAYSATFDGYVDVHTEFHPEVTTRVRYLAFASAGQTMTVKLASPNLDDLSFGVVGQQDGLVYVRYQIKNNCGEVHLPVSQGYYLDVYSVSGISTAFTLDLTIR